MRIHGDESMVGRPVLRAQQRMGKVRASSYPYYDGLLVREHHLQLPEILPMLGCLTVSAAAAVAAEHAAVGAPRVLRRVPAGHVQLPVLRVVAGLA